MIKNTLMVLLALFIAVPAFCSFAQAATFCTVNYYYISSENPEGVPKPTTGTLVGGRWKIKPASVSTTVYIRKAGNKTTTYTFKGWYTNINCLGKSYKPGMETTELKPALINGKYSINLYGKWLCESANSNTQSTRSTQNTRSTSASVVPSSHPASASTVQNKVREKKRSSQIIYSISAFTFPETGGTRSLDAKASSGLTLRYSSGNPAVISVDQQGVMKANGPGTATITITQSGNKEVSPVSKTIKVSVPSFRGRAAALAPWKHILIDTFFQINGRRYSLSRPGKYWADSKGDWSGRTGRSGNTQSCITLPTVSLKRTGVLSHGSGNIWLSSNMSSKPNSTVRRLKKNSSKLKITYPHKSLRSLVRSGRIRYGDIVCRSGHTFIYMGRNADGDPLAFDGGTQRNIGNGTRVIWGSHKRLTSKVKKQIKASDAQGEKWKKGILSDEDFNGHIVSGKNLRNSIHIVCSINTFTIKTSCVNGTISLGNTYMAGQNVRVNYTPAEGRTLKYVQVDGRRVSAAKNRSSYTFRSIGANHSIVVVYR